MITVKWKVSDIPTGRYRSFDERSWPTAEYSDGSNCAMLRCEDEYIPKNVKTGNHKPITVYMAKPNGNSFNWVAMKRTCSTIKEAKSFVDMLVNIEDERYLPESLKTKKEMKWVNE